MKLNKNNLIVLLLVGVLMVVMAIPTGNSKSRETYSTDTEKRLEEILSKMSGVGEVHVMVTYRDDEGVEGVAVIAEGGGNAVVIKNIVEVVQVLFPVESHKIRVIKAN